MQEKSIELFSPHHCEEQDAVKGNLFEENQNRRTPQEHFYGAALTLLNGVQINRCYTQRYYP